MFVMAHCFKQLFFVLHFICFCNCLNLIDVGSSAYFAILVGSRFGLDIKTQNLKLLRPWLTLKAGVLGRDVQVALHRILTEPFRFERAEVGPWLDKSTGLNSASEHLSSENSCFR